MDENVQLAPLFLQRAEHGLHRILALDIAGQDNVRAEACGERSDALLQRIALVGEGDLGARFGELLRNAPGDRMIVGDAHDEGALARQETGDAHYASSRLKTSEALVPPKPKEFDKTVPISTPSLRWRRIGMSATAGSISFMCALSARKPLFIISSE